MVRFIYPKELVCIMVSREQVAAIKFGIILGRTLQVDIPQIATDYANGLYPHEIATKYGVVSRYGIGNEDIATKAVVNAIQGNKFRFLGVPSYAGLIEDSQTYKGLARRHRSRNSQANGSQLFRQRKGIHADTSEEKRVHSLEGTLARGEIPWIERGPDEAENLPEVTYAYLLTQLPQYRGRKRTTYNATKIQRAINLVYHDGAQVRTTVALKLKLQAYIRRLRTSSRVC